MSKRFIREFIKTYRNEPALWQPKCEAYKNKKIRYNSWEVLLSKYHEEDPDATVEDVKKKINSLRASYRRELRKIAQSERGEGEADYKPQIWYFDELDFLRQHESQAEESTILDCRPKTETRLSKRKRNESNEVTSIDQDLEKETVKEQLSFKREKNESEDSLEEPLLYLEADNHKRARDDADVFAEGWAIIFRQLSKDQQIFAKRGIDELLMQGQLGMLTYASV